MASPTSLLGNARAFARDFPRDRMPQGYLWDVLDYVPTIIDAQLTGRGGWKWGSTVMGGDPETGIYVPFSTGDKGLVQAANGHLYEITLTPPYTAVDKGVIPRGKQNPVQLVDTVIAFDKTSAVVPQLITAPGGNITITPANAAHKKAPLGCVWKGYLVTAAAPGELDTVRFTRPNTPLTDANSFVSNSFYPTSLPVTGLAALRSVILVFHAGSVERFRGSTPAHDTVTGDLFLEPVFDRAGCVDPLSIAYWNDNCVFADEHGVHVTDGSVIRNLVSQGGILYFWRQLYENKLTLCGTTFLDYYICTVRRSGAVPPVTLICDLNKRQWFRFSNINALCYVASSSGVSMERVWAGLAGTGRVARLSSCFFPVLDGSLLLDDDGTPVLPAFETPWYRLAQEGRKRSRFVYLSYDVRNNGIPAGHVEPLAAVAQMLSVGYIRSPQQTTYLPLGTLPVTDQYTRYRLPLGQRAYGIAFKVSQVLPSSVLRVFDLAMEAQAMERSAV